MTERYGTRPGRMADEPSFALTSKARSWQYINGNQRNAACRDLSQPAPTVHFGHASNAVDWAIDGIRERRVSPSEASVLQSFPVDYPWRGSRSKQFEQIGNAIPPLMAAAILGNLLDLPSWRDVCMSMRPELPERQTA